MASPPGPRTLRTVLPPAAVTSPRAAPHWRAPLGLLVPPHVPPHAHRPRSCSLERRLLSMTRSHPAPLRVPAGSASFLPPSPRAQDTTGHGIVTAADLIAAH